MSFNQSIKPRDRLLTVAELWSAATGRSLGALSSVVTNHGSTLDRLRDPGNAVTDATLEKFAAYLLDPANWPEPPAGQARVPDQVRAFAHAVGVSLSATPLATGKTAANSHAANAA